MDIRGSRGAFQALEWTFEAMRGRTGGIRDLQLVLGHIKMIVLGEGDTILSVNQMQSGQKVNL